MLFFPNAKVNIGLKVIRKRPDGYHDIETIFCPVAICDMLEFVPGPSSASDKIRLTVTGMMEGVDPEKNLVVKAYHLLARDYKLPPLSVHLHKLIPVGAGLGGGSSDAAFMLKNLNSSFELGITEEGLCDYASALGSDCAFFIKNKLMLGYERGNRFRDVSFNDHQLEILVVNPGIHVNTADAYAGVSPGSSGTSLEELVRQPLEDWRNNITNDFEDTVFSKYPNIGILKEQMYTAGAIFASMSGSGSSVYGLFRKVPEIKEMFQGMFCWKGALK